jgi:hypothetical protein
VLEIADAIEAGASNLVDSVLGSIGTVFDEYRSEMIARTELMDAYNAAALGSYSDAGIEMVEAIDGDQDQECIDRVANNPYTIGEADAEEDHPNGTLDWVPVMPGMASLKGVVMSQPPRSGPPVFEGITMSPVVAAMLQAAIAYGEREQLAPVVNVAAPRIEAPVIVNNLPQQVPPDIHVSVEAQKADMPAMPDIHVHVPEQAPPVVNVNVPEPRPKRVVYKPDGKVDRVEPY